MNGYIERLRAEPGDDQRRIRFIRGHPEADLNDGCLPSFDEAVTDLAQRERAGMIVERDHKCRFDGAAVHRSGDDGSVVIRVGPTDFYRCARDVDDPVGAAKRRALGSELHDDPARFLACGIGVVAAVLSTEGRVLMGRRAGPHYPGFLHFPAGWLPFDCDVERIDARAHTRVEALEEVGLALDRLDFLGIVAYESTFETDIVFRSIVPDELLVDLVDQGRWRTAIDASEHTHLVLADPLELVEREMLVPSALYALDRLTT